MGNCSSMLTKQCLGSTDPRYDVTASNNLLDQGDLWKQYAGYWGPFVERRNTLSDNNSPRKPSFFNSELKVGWPYESGVFTSYRKVTIDGTRLKSTKFYFYNPASEEFCSQAPPEGMRNSIDPNQVCGEHGNFQIIEEFGTSTYEKDGTCNLIWVNIGPDSDESSGVPSVETSMSLVDDDAIFTYVHQPGLFTYSLTETFYGLKDTYLIGVGSGASDDPSAPNFQRQSGSLSGPKIIGEDQFLSALKKAFDDHKVAAIPDWIENGEAIPSCLAEQWGSCPTEDDWCSNMDPSCSESIYKEPAASLNGFGITLTASLVVSLFFFCGYILKLYIVAKQQKRFKTHFAKIMADRLGHVGHLAQLDPKELEEEFKRIDGGLDEDGMISKDELWKWIQSGKAGTMRKEDFNALFQSMDVDGDGEVSFIEFCGFMARCGSEYDKEAECLLERDSKQDKIKGIAKMVSMKKLD